jgi:hypothetical protein
MDSWTYTNEKSLIIRDWTSAFIHLTENVFYKYFGVILSVLLHFRDGHDRGMFSVFPVWGIIPTFYHFIPFLQVIGISSKI